MVDQVGAHVRRRDGVHGGQAAHVGAPGYEGMEFAAVVRQGGGGDAGRLACHEESIIGAADGGRLLLGCLCRPSPWHEKTHSGSCPKTQSGVGLGRCAAIGGDAVT